MDFVTVRELRAESGKVWEKIAAGEEIVITRNGKPFAIMAPTQPSEVEDKLRALRAAGFAHLLAEQHRRSVALGLDKMTPDEIDEEIALARKDMRKRNAGGR
jgi:prevent-host-death family protein